MYFESDGGRWQLRKRKKDKQKGEKKERMQNREEEVVHLPCCDRQKCHILNVDVCIVVYVRGTRLELFLVSHLPSFTFTHLLTPGVVEAPQMTSQPVSSIFLCSPLLSGTLRSPGLSNPWCCLPTSFFFFLFSVCLVFFPAPTN